MNHLAIDLGSRESQICVRNSKGEILEEERRATTGLGKYLAGKEKCRVVVESCAEAFSIADAARKAGHEVKVVPTSLVRALGVGSRGIKNDVRDAQNLSKLLMTAPGVGPVTAVRYVAAIDEVSRFHDAHGVESYLGLIPGENSSGDAKKRRILA